MKDELGFEDLRERVKTPSRRHTSLSMEQNCERLRQQTVDLEGLGPVCSPTYGWVTLGCVPTLSVPWCFLICKMGLIMVAVR